MPYFPIIPEPVPATPLRGIPKTGDPDDGGYGLPLEGDRFVDNGDGTVSDVATGLMWTKDPWNINHHEYAFRQTLDFAAAVSECASLTYAGHDDWHLPNIFQLYLMVARPGYFGSPSPLFTVKRGEITEGMGPPIYGYWSSTTHPFSQMGFMVDFESGAVMEESKLKSQAWLFHCLAWPVREAYIG